MTVHFNKTCHSVDNIICKVPCESHWNKGQPKLVMRGFSKKIDIIDGVAYIK